uniref:Uncharacterized protein n=1 Tax=Meloidogyne enterolobii TaxID=390850 RepID=A0A6V7X4I9_MELEN|nr:unnamed protein product [Meloidogyne enterolobii]
MEAKVLEKLLKAQQEQFEKMLVRLLKPSEMNDTELYSKLVGMIGLPSDATSVRQVAMKSVESKSERGQAVTLKEIIEECRAYMANKSEALYLVKEKISEVKKEVPVVNTVQKVKSYEKNESGNGSECKPKWTKPNVKYQQNVIEKKCSHCGRFGHWRMHCKFLNDKKFQPKRQWSNDNNHSGSPYCAILDIFDPMQSIEKEEWIKQKVKFGELEIEMIVDTASQINVVTKEVWKSIGQPTIEKVNYSGIGLGDNKVEIEGKFRSKVRVKDKDVFMEFHLVHSEVCILGLPGLKEVSVQNEKSKYNKWSKKKANFKIQKNSFPNGTKVKVKNTNKRSGKIEWLNGEILRKTANAWKIKVPVLKSIVTRTFKEIRRDQWNNKKKLLNVDMQNMNMSEEKVLSESSVTSSSASSVDSSKRIKSKMKEANGNKSKMKDVEEEKQMEM